MTDAEFYERINRCRDSAEVQWLCEQRAVETPGSGVTRDSDGILHGSDERLEIDANVVREETILIGTRQYTLIGNKRQRDAMRQDLMHAFGK